MQRFVQQHHHHRQPQNSHHQHHPASHFQAHRQPLAPAPPAPDTTHSPNRLGKDPGRKSKQHKAQKVRLQHGLRIVAQIKADQFIFRGKRLCGFISFPHKQPKWPGAAQRRPLFRCSRRSLLRKGAQAPRDIFAPPRAKTASALSPRLTERKLPKPVVSPYNRAYLAQPLSNSEEPCACQNKSILGHSSLYFEDFAIDQTVTSPARTITEADVVNFAGLSGDHSRIGTDAEYAARHPFGQRVAHGLLGLSIAVGLVVRMGFIEESSLGFREIDGSWRRPSAWAMPSTPGALSPPRAPFRAWAAAWSPCR